MVIVSPKKLFFLIGGVMIACTILKAFDAASVNSYEPAEKGELPNTFDPNKAPREFFVKVQRDRQRHKWVPDEVKVSRLFLPDDNTTFNLYFFIWQALIQNDREKYAQLSALYEQLALLSQSPLQNLNRSDLFARIDKQMQPTSLIINILSLTVLVAGIWATRWAYLNYYKNGRYKDFELYAHLYEKYYKASNAAYDPKSGIPRYLSPEEYLQRIEERKLIPASQQSRIKAASLTLLSAGTVMLKTWLESSKHEVLLRNYLTFLLNPLERFPSNEEAEFVAEIAKLSKISDSTEFLNQTAAFLNTPKNLQLQLDIIANTRQFKKWALKEYRAISPDRARE